MTWGLLQNLSFRFELGGDGGSPAACPAELDYGASTLTCWLADTVS